jgi:hypothetical protein
MPIRRDASRGSASGSGRYSAVPRRSRCLYEGSDLAIGLHGFVGVDVGVGHAFGEFDDGSGTHASARSLVSRVVER